MHEQTITVHVPMNMRRWGGKKVVISPTGQDLRKLDKNMRKDEKLLKALGRAYRWQKWLATGKYISVEEISDIENISHEEK